MSQSEQIKEVLKNASIKDNSVSIFAHTNKVQAVEIAKLLLLGLEEIKRSGAGITLIFKIN